MTDTTTAPGLPTGIDLGDDLGWALAVLLRTYRDRVGDALGAFPHGPRGYETMAEVLRGTQPSQLALANHLGIDRTVMTYLVDDLEREGLVERRPDPDDRRRRMVVATERGRDLVEVACKAVVAAQDELLGPLASGERSTLRHLLKKAALATGEEVADPCEVSPE
ncbi:MarR family transcriptional regulator [Agromyces protaetiae]|uniref:MarR family transcriptional regulator n=1 Tax=Agromyces protaetiae TaxID=2509455 RepID=A0A4P6FFD5_9MICO|nr:MarR family winged helix-turn-helix transcriptional regulator [Agromyces protaetiae]QAY74664.1 MarR family transcriptional regulator [Agromyces protaetiae]